MANSAVGINSEDLYSYCNTFESQNVAILVDACESGEFAYRFANKDNYMVMTSTDHEHKDLRYPKLGYHLFSWCFFHYPSSLGFASINAFYFAETYCHDRNPQIVDNADYYFF